MNLFVIFGVLAVIAIIVMVLDKFVLHISENSQQNNTKPPAYIELTYSWGPLVTMVFSVLLMVSYFNFTLILTLATLISLIVVVINRLFFVAKRKEAVKTYKESVEAPDERVVKELSQGSAVLEFIRSIFPVLLVVFVLRSFLVEPFQIPSGSMLPTLKVGDFILVNKFTYGIRLPVINKVIIPIGQPKRGDVAVFHYPPNPDVDYIKRVIGVPGDRIQYKDKRLYINGQLIGETFDDTVKTIEKVKLRNEISGSEEQRDIAVDYKLYTEDLDGVSHAIYKMPSRNSISSKPDQEWIVPEGYYFMMGDNRDNSLDSRFWIRDYAVQRGYIAEDAPLSDCWANKACSDLLLDDKMYMVPADNIVGKAFMVWMHWPDPKLSHLPSFSNDRLIK